MPAEIHLSEKEKRFMCELYKCHYTIGETVRIMGYSYNTVRMYFHGYGMMGIKKYDRMQLMDQEIRNDVECNTRQTTACR